MIMMMIMSVCGIVVGERQLFDETVKECDVVGSQFERLDLAQLVRRQRRYDLTQRRERFVQRLRALAFAHVRHGALYLQLVLVDSSAAAV